MNLDVTNEVIALVVGLLTTVVVPYLNKRFGMHLNATQIATTATDELEQAAKKLPFAPTPTRPASMSMPFPEVPIPPMSRPLDLPPVPPNENGAM